MEVAGPLGTPLGLAQRTRDGVSREVPCSALMVWGLPRCVCARESTAPAQGNQSLSRELRASALCPGLDEKQKILAGEEIGAVTRFQGHAYYS